MKREIKFRAWDEEKKKMWWNVESAYDTLHCHNYNHKEEDEDCDCEEHRFMPSSFGKVLRDTNYIVMQFTGLLDRNGKEIYEGDIVKGNPNGSTGIRVGKVEWLNDGWVVSDETERDNEKRLWQDFFSRTEIIGNIYENTELIK